MYKTINDINFIEKFLKCSSKTSSIFLNSKEYSFKVKNKKIYLSNVKDDFYKAMVIFNNVCYKFNIKTLQNMASFPTSMELNINRSTIRYKVNNNINIRLIINNNEFKLNDISVSGLSFLIDPAGKKNFTLNSTYNAKLIINKNNIIHFDISLVRNDKNLYGASFNNIDWDDRKIIFDFINSNMYQNIYDIKKYSSEEILNLFKESNYMTFNDIEEEKTTLNQMKNIQNKISNEISFSPVFYKEKILALADLIRIYNNTFLGQHLISTMESRRILNSKTDIYLNLLDYMTFNDKCMYYLAYYDASNKWHTRMYEYYNEIISDSDLFKIDGWNSLNVDINKSNLNYQSKYHSIIKNEPTLFTNHLNNIEKYAYSYDNFNLNSIKEIYNNHKLNVDRKLFHIYDKDTNLVAFAVAEVFSDYLNMANFLDQVRIYEITEFDYNDVLKSIIPALNSFYTKNLKTKYQILAKLNTNTINISEVHKSDRNIGRVMMSKKGILIYRNLVASHVRKTG
jgi:hypothetical protein